MFYRKEFVSDSLIERWGRYYLTAVYMSKGVRSRNGDAERQRQTGSETHSLFSTPNRASVFSFQSMAMFTKKVTCYIVSLADRTHMGKCEAKV